MDWSKQRMQRLQGELIVQTSIHPSSINNFKHLLLWSHWDNWNIISRIWGNKSLFKWLGLLTNIATMSIYGKKPRKIFFQKVYETWHKASWAWGLKYCSSAEDKITWIIRGYKSKFLKNFWHFLQDPFCPPWELTHAWQHLDMFLTHLCMIHWGRFVHSWSSHCQSWYD